MPRYTKPNGKRVPNVRIEKAWIDIPTKDGKTATYLVQPKVADYIEKLENRIKCTASSK